jgi:PAS domain S-box-containing protein
MVDRPMPPSGTRAGVSARQQRSLSEWREQVFLKLLRIVGILGTVVAVPSMILLVDQGQWPIAVLDLVTLAVLLTLWRYRTLPYIWRAGVFCGLLYLLGMSFLMTMGVETQVYLMAAPIMAGILLGHRAAYATLAVATVSLVAGGYLKQVDVRLVGLEAHPFWMWVVIGANFALITGLLTIALVFLLRGLERSLERANDSEQRYRTAFDTSPDAMVISRMLDGTMLYVNESFLRILGWTRDEVIGRTGLDIQLWADASVRSSVQQHMRAQGTVENLEADMVCKDGTQRCALLSARTLDLNGEPCILYVARDITERKESEQELQRYRQGLEALVVERTSALEQSNRNLELQHDFIQTVTDAAPVLISYWDADLHCRFANLAFRSVFAAPVDDFLGVHASGLLSPGFYKGSAPFLASALQGSSQRFPANVGQSGDATRFLLVKCVPHQVAERVVGVYMLADDITELKLAERQLRGLNYELSVQVEAAQVASRAKSEFLAAMSHEIRTPMNGVLGMVDVMQQTALTVQQQRMLDTIRRSSETLLHILNDILDYSKIEAGKFDVERVPTRLHDVVEGVMSLLDTAASAKGVELNAEIAPELPEWLISDPTRLQQILINLLGNAVKFTPSQPGRIGRVLLAVQRVAASDGSATLLLRVRDNGIGIEKEMQRKLFNPFTQAHAGIARKFGGTGLGLSITSQLVSLMGGEVRVTSVLGEGSEFVVMLPLEACAAGTTEHRGEHQSVAPIVAASGEVPGITGPAAYKPLILLAEDNETNRDVIEQQLRLLGYGVESANDGQSALAMWASGRYALLMTDCHMPTMDGFALTRAIRASEPAGHRSPIIAVTANAMQGEGQRCREAGMDDYLSKPLRLSELEAMLHRWMPVFGADRSTSPAVWDPHTLTGMVGESVTVRRRVLDKFLQKSRESIEQMTTLAQGQYTGRATALADVAHKLKSGARTVGALALGDVCQRLEDAGRAGNDTDATAMAYQAAVAFEQASRLIRRDLDEQVLDNQGV